MDYMDNVVFISFDYDNLTYVKEKYPTQKVQYLTWNIDDELIGKLKAWNMDLDIYYQALTEENIRLCHDNNIEVNCWTVDDSDVAQQLIAWGIDYTFSPRSLLYWRSNKSAE